VSIDRPAGLTTDKASEAVAAWLETRRIGSRKVNYKLRDWLFARQVRPAPLLCSAAKAEAELRSLCCVYKPHRFGAKQALSNACD
jgi:hypothetical protein